MFEDPNAPNLSEASDVYIYYSLQIHFRKTLNRAHSLVYKPGVEYIAPKSILEGLQGIRDVIEGFEKPQALRGWNDDDPTSPDINVSRIRGKYYGARYIILRPFLQHALSIMKPRYVQIQNVGASDEIPQMRLLDLRARDNRRKHEDRDEETVLGIIRGTKGCIDAAMSSTIAFDGLSPDRFLVTNIHGTALAYVLYLIRI